MPSAQKCADRLREDAYKSLTPRIQALEDELQELNKLFADKILNIGYKLEALRHTELPAAESTLNEYLRDDMRKRDIEGEMLTHFTRGLRTKETQEEILTSLLDSVANCFPRVALFVVRSDSFRGWSSRGFSESTSEAVSSDEFPISDCPGLMEALMSESQTESVELPDVGSLSHMREESSGVWQLYPLHVLGRPVALLLAGENEGFVGRPKALSLLMDCAALRLENVALKIIKTLSESASARSSDADSLNAKLVFYANPTTKSPIEMSPTVLNLNPASQIETPALAESIGESRHEPGVFRPYPAAELPPEPVTETPAAAAPAAAATAEPMQETIVETTPVAAQSAAYSPFGHTPNLETETLNAAARRFAELLVSEIKDENEEAVAQGRKNRDLYKRLQKTMDRDREMYEKRVAPTVASRFDYLHDEFVRILGGGDARSLGEGYPGPRFRDARTGL